jgi:hypothetical protein
MFFEILGPGRSEQPRIFFFKIGISEAQEIPVIDSLATSSNRLSAAHLNFQ